MNFILVNNDGKYLTNHGFKFWFTDSLSIAIYFDTENEAQRLANFYNCKIQKHI
jgi:hypothetical protein